LLKLRSSDEACLDGVGAGVLVDKGIDITTAFSYFCLVPAAIVITYHNDHSYRDCCRGTFIIGALYAIFIGRTILKCAAL
jgi:hypothetical protein